ncbi:hypothetical protein ACEQ8H_004052 [Pleosporales sp. CAS-2024a]
MADKSATMHTQRHLEDLETAPPMEHLAELQQSPHVDLTWRSWAVVFWSCFAVMAQIYVVVAAGFVLAFIIRDVGDAPLAGWIIQGPLLMQAVLSPVVGRLSDVLDKKNVATITPLVAFAGAVMSAKAKDMTMLIIGGVLIGTTLATVSIVQAIPSEVLPLKYRAVSNGLAFIGGALGGIMGTLGAGAMVNANPAGWRNIFWLQAALHIATSVGLYAFYWPKKDHHRERMSFKQLVWAIDPIGSSLFIGAATMLLLALDWAGGAYDWSDAHVAAPLGIGFALLLAFGVYEWKGRSDGIVAHVFFKGSPNFALACFAFAIEGWLFFGAVNSYTPQIVLNLGFASTSWMIGLRQQAYNATTLFGSMAVTFYATKYKDLKSPLIATFGIFCIVVILYGCITPSWSHAQIGVNVLSGLGQSGPLTLLVALIQFTAPHAYLSTATGLAFSSRAIGGAFGSAVLNAISNGKLKSTYTPQVSRAALGAGLPESSLPALFKAFATGEGFDAIPGVTPAILGAATNASRWAYTHAYRLAWWSVLPFAIIALVSVACVKDVSALMTEHVEATVERNEVSDEKAVV